MNIIFKSLTLFSILSSFLYSSSSMAYEHSSSTKMLIEIPQSNLLTTEKLGLKGAVSKFEIGGYRVYFKDGREILYLIPKEVHEFSSAGFLEFMSKDSPVTRVASWKFENDRLIQLKESRKGLDNNNISSMVVDYEYNEKKELKKIVSETTTEGSTYPTLGCNHFSIKGDVVYVRHCAGDQNVIYTYNNDQQLIFVERRKLKNTEYLVVNFNKNIKEKYIYKNGSLYEIFIYYDDIVIQYSLIIYDENNNIITKTVTNYQGEDVISEEYYQYDKYGNQTDFSIERSKPIDHNPILGAFEPRSATRTKYVQKNDEYGNPLSRISTHYKIEIDQTETLINKEYRSFKYKYYESAKSQLRNIAED